MEKEAQINSNLYYCVNLVDNAEVNIKEEVDTDENTEDADESLLYENTATSSEKSEYKCNTCNKSFIHSSSLKRHQSQFHNNIQLWQCEVCKKYFATEINLKKHQLTHTPDSIKNNSDIVETAERPYECEYCHRSFVRLTHLQRHVKIHSSNVPLFKCQICDKTYTQEVSLKQHAAKHAAYYEYNCHICHKQFIRLLDHVEHMKEHEAQNRNAADLEWTNDQICVLINLFKDKRELWDPSDWNYVNKQIKPQAWQDIANALNMTKHEVETKIWSLISRYQMEERMRRINGNEPQWFAFKLFSFLETRNRPRINLQNRSLESNESTDESYKDDEFNNKRNTVTPSKLELTKKSSLNINSKNYKYVSSETLNEQLNNNESIFHLSPEKRNNCYNIAKNSQKELQVATTSNDMNGKKIEEMLSKEVQVCETHNDKNYLDKLTKSDDLNSCNLLRKLYNKMSRDEYDIFGESIACGIRNLKTSYAKSTVKYHINNILYQAELGHYDHPPCIGRNSKQNSVNKASESIVSQEVSTVDDLDNMLNEL